MQRVAESEELRLYMEATGGSFIHFDNEEKDSISRKIFATFTKEEMENLSQYGDFISIDPTFCPMSSNWSIIPLTVIGQEREIRSGGLIFSSSLKSDNFRWILKILINDLPTKGKLCTICSDDDTGLAGAFTETKLKLMTIY